MALSTLLEALARSESNENQQAAPVFVIGAPRSGTSVLAWALAEHPHFATSFEADFVIELLGGTQLVRSFQKGSAREDGWLARNQVPLEEYCAHLGAGLDQMYRSRLEARRWIDGTPRHVLMGPQLALLFPDARFLHIIRNGERVVDSLVHSGFESWSARNFVFSCLTWVRYLKAGQRLARLIPGRVHEIRYEDIVGGGAWGQLFEFLAEKPNQDCARFVAEKRINSSFGLSSDSHDKIVKRQQRGKRWSWPKRLLFKQIAGPLMKELGY